MKFTTRTDKIFEIARNFAIESNSTYIGTEHILYGIVIEGTSKSSQYLLAHKVDELALRKEIMNITRIGSINTKRKKNIAISINKCKSKRK